MTEQFFTTCRFCGKQILMTKNLRTNKWVACEPEIRRFRPAGGPNTYITPEGEVTRGERDRDGIFGYKKHGRHREQ